jgi:hypothetical protein
MLPDWCRPLLKPFLGNPPVGTPAAHNFAVPRHPLGTSSAHSTIGIGHHGAQANYTYVANKTVVPHAAAKTIPLWAKKAALISAACATPPLALTAVTYGGPAGPIPHNSPVVDPVGPQAVPEPGSLLVMPLGVAAVVVLSRRRHA